MNRKPESIKTVRTTCSGGFLMFRYTDPKKETPDMKYEALLCLPNKAIMNSINVIAYIIKKKEYVDFKKSKAYDLQR